MAIHTSRRTEPIVRARARRKSRRGVETFELILVIPILLVATLAIFQYGVITLFQHAITHAATVGAREAGKGATIEEVVERVNVILDTVCLEVINSDTTSDARVVLEVAGLPTREYGDPDIDCLPPETPVILPDEVRVTICVDVSKSSVSGFLSHFGLSMTGKTIEVSSLVKKEYWQDFN